MTTPPTQDVVSLDALSSEELQYIVGNSKYRNILSDLLAPFVEVPPSEAGSENSADHTVTDDQSERGTTPVVYRLGSSAGRQEGGADTSPFTASKKALKWPSNGSSSQTRKEQRVSLKESRKRKRVTDTLGLPTKRAKTPSSQQAAARNQRMTPLILPSTERIRMNLR